MEVLRVGLSPTSPVCLWNFADRHRHSARGYGRHGSGSSPAQPTKVSTLPGIVSAASVLEIFFQGRKMENGIKLSLFFSG